MRRRRRRKKAQRLEETLSLLLLSHKEGTFILWLGMQELKEYLGIRHLFLSHPKHILLGLQWEPCLLSHPSKRTLKLSAPFASNTLPMGNWFNLLESVVINFTPLALILGYSMETPIVQFVAWNCQSLFTTEIIFNFIQQTSILYDVFQSILYV